jgi:hypothetical protein
MREKLGKLDQLIKMEHALAELDTGNPCRNDG